ncbi:CDP-diacylglycerol--serine O-phosphatidyltransferase [Streptomyces mobaraensis NBRC 13819 = DSM 40847]|uniref:CDP-diacylglycerol--serine O-phosphatidyltransferase n=1 Tax=Streptomyces mobaraensis (strain ATCC 29032 / DSM 40847 / JCM 4168 / NBRC 13819 / NCIMB 11159 / IPCR 16-22) TaxID=1223523 RepID=M3A3R1_STRM1|nr:MULTISPECIES: CDP-diacylglycerol--serine O-phosphatidyltransferase [Streptomyces]EME99708.1 CDP-diacylglycerol/serine O-phosphatidyltransferase [Streptomyces mobaraensis NBRC 13819 = DSM 40847]MBC2877026.1 CDP-diacylglycerol--serine O-phosphatidyltransferase [Streptomyces sp. TYQ1024]QTT76433.1 CDP-diacylglycerol--serine O-phosphatidyltransferase [Streptomyces mobaraensis NBRC 13819 = DSM 40847]UBI36049.1 CDP-diacylglycerol--serine O-phosphatidyltransferase [Streptomyces mobaraensis]UKW2864
MTVIDPDTQATWVPEAEPEDDVDDMPLSTRLSIADTLTLGNAICGFMAVYFTTTGILIPHLTNNEDGGMARNNAATAVMLMLLASVFDLFDGLVARKLRSSAMGAELDNLSDLISFGLAPAYFVVVWGVVAQGAHQKVSAVAAVVVLLAVVLRLARFSCVTLRDGIFQGMPSPFGALTVVSVVLLELPFVPTLLAIVGVAWLMVSRVEYPKPRGRLAVAMLSWIVLSMGLLAAWAFDAPGGELLLQTGCALQVVLGAVIPLFATARRVNTFRDNRREARAAQLP